MNSSIKKTHYATCKNAFDNRTGNRKSKFNELPYFDVTDCAQTIRDDSGEKNNPDLLISKESFLESVFVDKWHEAILNHPSTEFLFVSERKSHIMYDAVKDIHHFYERG
jgi:hypothetical protein